MLSRRIIGFSCIALLCGLFVTARARRTVCTGFLPPNSMRIPVGALRVGADGAVGGLNEAQYNAVMDHLQKIYGPIVASLGGTLQINRLWTDPTVNSSAQREGTTYVLNMYGGLARHPAITQDGETLVACHEMSHHLGGAPKEKYYNSWATNEGQSDYAGVLKCLRLMFADGGSTQFTRATASDPVAEKACQVFKDPKDQTLCVRSAMAGMSVTALFKDLSHAAKDARFDTPNTAVVQQTNDEHPEMQCRLDTYFQGSLCTQPVSAKQSDTDPATGTCTFSQGYKVGMRPLCWYKPESGELVGLVSRPTAAAQVGAAISKSSGLSLLQSVAPWQGL